MKLLVLLFISVSTLAGVGYKKRVTKLISHPFVEKVHGLMINKALERIEEFDQKNFARMKKLVQKTFDFNKIKYSLIDEIEYMYSKKEFSDLESFMNKPYFEKFYKTILDLEAKREISKEAEAYMKTIEVQEKGNEYRALFSQKIVLSTNRLFTHLNLTKTLSKVIFTEYNKRINMKALDALEQSIFFYNLEEKEKIRNKNIREKYLYYKTRRDVLSDLVEYDRMVKKDVLQRFVLKLLDYFNYYYNAKAEDMGLIEENK